MVRPISCPPTSSLTVNFVLCSFFLRSRSLASVTASLLTLDVSSGTKLAASETFRSARRSAVSSALSRSRSKGRGVSGGDSRASSACTSQPRASRENVPGARAKRARRERRYPGHEPTARVERRYPGHEPTARVEREYTRGTSHPHVSRENVPGARANRARRERIYLPHGLLVLPAPVGVLALRLKRGELRLELVPLDAVLRRERRVAAAVRRLALQHRHLRATKRNKRIEPKGAHREALALRRQMARDKFRYF
eukprot:308521-Prorocentrum_minimum.AAC.1